MEDNIIETGIQKLVLTEEPRFIRNKIIDGEGMSWIEQTMSTLPPSLINFIVGTEPNIISVYNIKRYGDTIQKESGKTLFLVRVGTMEKLTRRLLNDRIISISLDWGIRYNFYSYPSEEISELIRKCRIADWFRIYYYSKTGKSHPESVTQALLYHDIKESTNRIIKNIIPNFPLTIREWEFPHWKNNGFYISRKNLNELM